MWQSSYRDLTVQYQFELSIEPFTQAPYYKVDNIFLCTPQAQDNISNFLTQTLSGSLLLHYNTTTQKIQMKIWLVGIWIQTSSLPAR